MKIFHRKNAANLMTIGLLLNNKRQSEVVPGLGWDEPRVRKRQFG